MVIKGLTIFDFIFEGVISPTVEYVEKQGWVFKEYLGHGAFGCVVKMENSKDKSEVAVKIAQKNEDLGEILIWRRLQHPNILKLISAQYVPVLETFVFIMPLFPSTLQNKLSDKTKNIKLSVSIQWVKQISEAFTYLHSQKLWHLDLKTDNVLISDKENAVLSDFGFLTYGDKPVNRFGSPRIYGPPEARFCEEYAKVSGYSFDVWRIGMLAFEIFTRLGLFYEWKEIKPNPIPNWICQVYPTLQQMLVKKAFFKRMKRRTTEAKKKVEDILNFIKFSLHVIPEERPSAQQLLSHRLFGGCLEYTEFERWDKIKVDIWKKALSATEVYAIIERYKSDFALTSTDDSVVMSDPTEKEDVCRPFWVPIVGPKYFSDVEIEKEREPVENKYDIDESFSMGLRAIFGDESESKVSSGNAATSLENEQCVSSSEVRLKHANENKKQRKNCCQRLRSWWKRAKSACCEFFTCCVPCGKRKEQK